MMWVHLASAVATLLGCVLAVDVQKVVWNVPQKDRFEFLYRYAMVGYELAHGNTVVDYGKEEKFSTLDDVSEFCVALYEWLLENCRIKHLMGRSFSRHFGPNIICFPNHQCVDVGDVGVHP